MSINKSAAIPPWLLNTGRMALKTGGKVLKGYKWAHTNPVARVPTYVFDTALGLKVAQYLGLPEFVGHAAAPYGAQVVSKVTDPLADSIGKIGDKAVDSVDKFSKAVVSQQDKLGGAVGKMSEPITKSAERLGGAFGKGLTSMARGAVFAAGGAGLAGIPTALLTAKYLPGDKNKALRSIINMFGTAAGGALGLVADRYLGDRLFGVSPQPATSSGQSTPAPTKVEVAKAAEQPDKSDKS